MFNFDKQNIGKGPAVPIPDDLKTVASFMETSTDAVKMMVSVDPLVQIIPLITAVCGNGQVVPLMLPNLQEDQKDTLVDMMRGMFLDWGVVRYTMVMETWVSQIAGQTGVRPTDASDRKEAITILAVDTNGENEYKVLEIIRNAAGEIIDIPVLQHVQGTRSRPVVGGRFAEFLVTPMVVENVSHGDDMQDFMGYTEALLNPPDKILKSWCKRNKQVFAKVSEENKTLWKKVEDAYCALVIAPSFDIDKKTKILLSLFLEVKNRGEMFMQDEQFEKELDEWIVQED